MKARRLIAEKIQLSDGTIQEMIVWILPAAVSGSKHNYKYRLFFGRS